MTPRPPSRYAAEPSDLDALVARLGAPAYRARQIHEALWDQRIPLEEASNLPQTLRDRLTDELPLTLELVTESRSADDTTVKWLWRSVRDGAQIETVLMEYPDRATVCVSSQAGCAMGCTFCATGQAGFERHLDRGEIVEQVVRAAHASTRRVSNVVFMGMGEPLANLDEVWAAIERIHGDLGISARQITVSTVGVVPGMRRLATLGLDRKSTRLNSSHIPLSRMPSSA